MAMTEDEFVEWLAVHPRSVEFVEKSIRGGLADYDNPGYYSPECKRDHDAAAIAICRNCHIRKRAERAALQHPELSVKILSKRNRTTFRFDDAVEFWFKALDKYGQPRMRHSQQGLAFMKQEKEPVAGLGQGMLDVPMPRELTRVYAGHKPKPNTGGVEFEIVVACPPESGTPWQVSLSGADVRELLIVPATSPAAIEVQDRIRQRVRLRSDPEGRSKRVSTKKDEKAKHEADGSQQ